MKMVTEQMIKDRVAEGVKYLNEHYPGWQYRINVGTFNISHCRTCIMGQLLGAFGATYDKDKDVWENPYQFGFDTDHLEKFADKTYKDAQACLQDTWVRVITALQQLPQPEQQGVQA